MSPPIAAAANRIQPYPPTIAASIAERGCRFRAEASGLLCRRGQSEQHDLLQYLAEGVVERRHDIRQLASGRWHFFDKRVRCNDAPLRYLDKLCIHANPDRRDLV